jgi:hypothetical protein
VSTDEDESCICPICDTDLDLDAAACRHCGTPLPELALVPCAACKTTNSPESVYCRHCGEVLTDKSPEARAFTRTFIQWLKDAGYKADVVRGIPCYTKGSALILIINEELKMGESPIHIIRFRSNVVRGLHDPQLIVKTLLRANSSLLLGSFGLEDDRIVYRYDWLTTEVPEELFLVIAGMIAEIIDGTDDYLAEMTGGETALGQHSIDTRNN